VLIEPGRLTLEEIRRLHAGERDIELHPAAIEDVRASAEVVERAVRGEQAVYGVNTGFGRLATTRIAASDVEELQANLVRSHATGVGEPLPPAVVRLTLALKAASLARGLSGVREQLVQVLLDVLSAGLVPSIPAQGSVGASGDLAPLAHLALALTGEGEMLTPDGRAPARPLLEAAGIEPVRLGPKEGLALVNGTQVSTALALHALLSFEPVLGAAMVIGAMTVDAARGSDGPFEARIHEARGHRAQIEAAAVYRGLMAGSEIRRSHVSGDDRVQDPYCLRCQPQVVGACLEQLRHSAAVLLVEANAVTDNPLVFAAGEGALVSGGNFHAEPVALAADAMAVAIAEVGAIAERRIAMLIDADVSGLPPFLATRPGLDSGFMVAHVTAAALASENKALAHPASVDSLPTSANQEDHVSMATFAARRLQPMIANVAHIVGIEAVVAAQALEEHRPLRSSDVVEEAHAAIRSAVPALAGDRYLAPDIVAATELVASGALGDLLKRLPDAPALFP